MEEETKSHKRLQQLKNPYVLGGLYSFAVLIVLVPAMLNRPGVGNLAADINEVEGVDEAIANGFSYAFGTPASEEIDEEAFTLGAIDPEIEQRFYDVLNTSPAYDWVTDVQDLLNYDDFDKDGNIKEVRVLEIIGVGEQALKGVQ